MDCFRVRVELLLHLRHIVGFQVYFMVSSVKACCVFAYLNVKVLVLLLPVIIV